MPRSFQLHSHGFSSSEALAAAARQYAIDLDGFFEGIEVCRVFVTTPPAHHRHGCDFEVRVELLIPGSRITVAPQPRFPGQLADAYVALSEAFKLARRQLSRQVHRRHRGEVKRHSQPRV